ncbi:HNH endonuclease family protein [Campylobacter ureolyticus]|uniref:HNH endonuclease family protein n=1 Tax=Campylobacter ureolyticus TaxID=827 RepID=UPI0026EB2E05|nr:HNH endonuclease family protein [Campylobacter ureolyticus]
MSNVDLLKEFDKVSEFDINFAKDFIKDMLKFRLIFDYFIFKRYDLDEPYFRDMRDKESFFNIKDSKALQMIELLFNHTAQNYKAQEWVQEVVGYVKDNLLNNENFDLISELENKDKERAEKHTDKELDKGTKVAHYWFYRLEYLLWKNFDNYFKGDRYQIVKERYYLTRLNSIEHIQPQSEAIGDFKGFYDDDKNNDDKKDNDKKKRRIDHFGNLALISGGRNSSLGNKSVRIKKAAIKEWVEKGDSIQSLKMLLALHDVDDQNTWNFEKAKNHGDEMKELLFKDLENNN